MASKGFFGKFRASMLFRQGLRHVKRGDFENALKCFESLLEYFPQDHAAWSNIGYCKFRMGKLAESVEAYQHAVQLAPDDAQYCFDLASVLMKINRIEEALQWYTRATRQKQNYANAFVGMGNAYFLLGKYAEASAAYKRALMVEPNNLEAKIGTGRCLLHTQQEREAYEVFQRLAKDFTEYPAVFEGLADAAKALGFPQEELLAREETARLQPFSAKAQLALAEVCERLGLWKRAFAAYQRALRLEPELSPAKEGLARAHEALQTLETKSSSKEPQLQTDESQPSVVSVSQQLPDSLEPSPTELSASDTTEPTLLHTLAPEEETANTSESILQPTSTTLTESENPQYLIEKGEEEHLAGRYESALSFWDRAIALLPNNPVVYNNRAATLLELKRYDEAREACLVAIQLDPTYSIARATLCEIFMQQGKRDEALQHYRELEKIDPLLAYEIRETFQF